MQIADRHGELEASRTGAAGIDELHTFTLGHHWLVRVSADDDIVARCPRIRFHLLHIVKDVNADTLQVKRQGSGDPGCPPASVIVSPDGIDGCKSPQFLEDLDAPDVPRMNDAPDAPERLDRLRSKQAVRIGNEPYRLEWLGHT